MFFWRVKLLHHLTSTQYPASDTSRQMECTSCCRTMLRCLHVLMHRSLLLLHSISTLIRDDTRALALWPEKMHESFAEKRPVSACSMSSHGPQLLHENRATTPSMIQGACCMV